MKSTSTGTFSATILRVFCRALDLHPRQALAAATGDASVLVDAECRVPLDVAFRVFDEAPHRTGLGDAGLVAARRTAAGALGIMDLICRASPTIGDALAAVRRFYPLIDDRTTIDFVPEDGLVRVVLRDRADLPAPRAAREYLLGLIAVRWTELTGRALPALRASFAFPRPPDVHLHHALFGPDVRFDQPSTELLLQGAGLQAPVRTADPLVLDYLETQADKVLQHLPRRDAWLDRARRTVMNALATHQASLEEAAKRLALSPRSLQRRLGEAGTSYQELLDSVRRELGIRWILDGSLGLDEVAERLDFSDATAFHRAFKRWTRDTPRAYQRRLRG